MDPTDVHCLLSSTVVTQFLAFLTQFLWMLLGLITDIQSIWLVQRTLLVWVHHDAALGAHLTAISPAVAAHPLASTGWTLVFAEATLLPLIRRQASSITTGCCCRRWRQWWRWSWRSGGSTTRCPRSMAGRHEDRRIVFS